MRRHVQSGSARGSAITASILVLVGVLLATGGCVFFVVCSGVELTHQRSVEAAEPSEDTRSEVWDLEWARGERRRQLTETRRLISERRDRLDWVAEELQRIQLSHRLSSTRPSTGPESQEALRRLRIRGDTLEGEASRIGKDLTELRRLESRHLDALDRSLETHRPTRDRLRDARVDAELLEILDPDCLRGIRHLLDDSGSVVESGELEKVMTHPLEDIEGIPPRVLDSLKRHWIDTAEQLLAAGARPDGPAQLSGALGLSEEGVRALLERAREAVGTEACAEMERPPTGPRSTGLLPEDPGLGPE